MKLEEKEEGITRGKGSPGEGRNGNLLKASVELLSGGKLSLLNVPEMVNSQTKLGLGARHLRLAIPLLHRLLYPQITLHEYD